MFGPVDWNQAAASGYDLQPGIGDSCKNLCPVLFDRIKMILFAGQDERLINLDTKEVAKDDSDLTIPLFEHGAI